MHFRPFEFAINKLSNNLKEALNLFGAFCCL